ncbi:MAG: hypothetical protein BWX86_02777 [Verrucomicrobia bacterium ADurb.Bin122]|nr:MAG: hypothetical protein BWX86_02777 [Verrucomicrobia bacterium ADurb.Bin122]
MFFPYSPHGTTDSHRTRPDRYRRVYRHRLRAQRQPKSHRLATRRRGHGAANRLRLARTVRGRRALRDRLGGAGICLAARVQSRGRGVSVRRAGHGHEDLQLHFRVQRAPIDRLFLGALGPAFLLRNFAARRPSLRVGDVENDETLRCRKPLGLGQPLPRDDGSAAAHPPLPRHADALRAICSHGRRTRHHRRRGDGRLHQHARR